MVVRRYDNTWALHQIEEGHNSILMRDPATDAKEAGISKHGKTLPRVITLGGTKMPSLVRAQQLICSR